MNKHKITVFTPTYNRAHTLERLYQSLKRQNFSDFEWLVVDDHDQCVFAIERKDKAGNAIIAVMNFVGNTHEKYKVPVNIEGSYKEILNTDQAVYSGKNIINPRAIRSKKTKPNEKTKLLNKDHYIEVKLAPFSACIFEVKPKNGTTKKITF